VRLAASISITSTWEDLAIASQWRPSGSSEMDGASAVGLVVQRPRDQAGSCGFTHTAHTGQHIGMGNPAGRERIGERFDHWLLADQIIKGLRAVFARENLIAVIVRFFGALQSRAGRGRHGQPALVRSAVWSVFIHHGRRTLLQAWLLSQLG
jgi:hypothetical protein